MNTILLAGFQDSEKKNSGMIEFNGQLWIDWQIEQLLSLGHQVTVVLGDVHSELLLSESKLIKMCDLVFDTNEITTLMTNLRAGLHSVVRHSNILPITTPAPHSEAWNRLSDHYFRINAEKFDLLRSFCPIDGQMHEGFPLIVTRVGAKKIKANEEIKSLTDSRLTFSPVPHLNKSIIHVFPEVLA